MYIRKTVPISKMLRWTRGHIIGFLLLALVPVFLYDILGLTWLHVPWLPLSVVGTAVAFIVGFKNNASYDRLWEARKIWGGIVNASRSFTIMVRDFVQDDQLPADELKSIHREMVHRHVAWLTALRYQLRTVRQWENKRASPANKRFRGVVVNILESDVPCREAIAQYITQTELKDVFEKENQASQLLGIQSARIKELRQRNLVGAYEHVAIEQALSELYALQGKSERIKNFPYPRQFATLNYMFVWLFIFLLPYGVMEEFEKIGDHIISEHPAHESARAGLHALWVFMGKHFVWFSIPFSATVSWVFYALEIVGEHSENPFEGGPNDVPITDLSRSIEIDIRQLIDDEGIPDPLVWGSGVVL
ncbi:bestrophin family protein [Bythopirellula goksoeyrii]|uniref:Bestrophin, RFP-TM, chloride channel n=1 Tax=Bythopirellula goksoeyrii TaxID=1400387 RepID=A0A5B9QPF2_9BACT|nr:bestrophin family ion channel [Bythopirellula goksoeyrii]QEG35863.1 Bestrophin, RFP-TM, chloride channel [Bythopirellula goksoeyrii]